MTRGLIVILSLLLAGAALAQVRSDTYGRPVDQTVEDMGPNAASLRRIDPGNAQFPTRSAIVELSQHASWRQLGVPDAHRYEYRAPGVTARLNRPDYLVVGPDGKPSINTKPVADGAFRELAPSDMVYSLMPDTPRAVDPAAQYPNWEDTRLDGRLNTRYQRTGAGAPQSGALPPSYIDPGHSAVPRTAAGYADDSSLQQVPVNFPRRQAVVREKPADKTTTADEQ